MDAQGNPQTAECLAPPLSTWRSVPAPDKWQAVETHPEATERRNSPQWLAKKGVFLPFYLIIHFHRNMILFTNIQVRDCWSKI